MPISKNICTIAILLFLFSFVCYAADTGITIGADTIISTIPDTLYGSNLASWCWFEDGNDLLMNEMMLASNRKLYRWPGGLWGDNWAWNDMEGGGNAWVISYEECLNFLGKVGGTMQPIVNCGAYWGGVQHTIAEAVDLAAAWVTDMNINRKLMAKYWEIGNEMGGFWATNYCKTGTEYAQRYCQFYKAMKAVDPTIKLGANAETCADCNGGWNGLMFTECLNQGIVPDFLIIHAYPTLLRPVTPENDAICLAAIADIKTYTDNLNAIVKQYAGPEYVGKIEYTLTEFSASPADRLYLEIMYEAQVILECAKYKWAITNPWAEDIFYRSGYVTPVFYLFHFLQYKFGRHMVTAASDNPAVGAYAAKDDAGNLSLLLVNNSTNASTTARIAVSGFSSSSIGEQWLFEPVYTGFDPQIPDSTYIQEKDDVKINGVVHPDPRLIDTQVLPDYITTGSSFSVTLPASAVAFIRILPSGKTPVPRSTATPAPTPAPLSTTGPVKVQYVCRETLASATSGRFYLNIVNTSSEVVPLKDLVVRYWYTREGAVGWEGITCDWAASIATTDITARFFTIYHYMDIYLGSGSIPAGGQTGEIQFRWNYGDWSAMDQSNDYSFDPSITTMSDYMKIGLYRNGKLIWGTEPEGLKPPKLLGATPIPTPTISRTATPAITGTPRGLMGDVNGSGTVDIVDALMIAQYYVGLNPTGFNSSVADVNCTGKIDIVDALLTAQYYVRLVSSWPC